MIDASEPSIITMRCSGNFPTESIFLVGSQLHSQTLVLYCTCLCRQSFFANMWILFFGWKQFLVVCLYMYCRWRINYLCGIRIQITCLTPPYYHACSKPGPEFSTPYVVVCLFCVQFIHVSDGCSLC